MKAPVTYEQEKQLGEDPIRLDFLIIKKQRDAVLTLLARSLPLL